MNNKSFIETFEKLSLLWESKQDIDNFVNKFGQDSYDLFKKSIQRLKNKGISTDLVWHTKNTDKKDLDNLLYNLQNRIITKNNSAFSKMAGDYELLGEDKGYKVYFVKDHIAAINLGVGTGWCISGRYGHYGESNYIPSETEAKKHWDDYKRKGFEFYFFINDTDKYALSLSKNILPPFVADDLYLSKCNFFLHNKKDNYEYAAFDFLPHDLINEQLIFDHEEAPNGFRIENNILLKVDSNKITADIPTNVTRIGQGAFTGCMELKKINIPSNIKYIDSFAFSGCTKLEEIILPESITKLSIGMFNECSALKSIKLSKNLKTLENSVFTGCKSLEKIELPNGIKKIKPNVFYGASGLKEVILPNDLTTIVAGMFNSCNNLEKIKIPESVTTIEIRGFVACTSLEEISIPKSVKNIGYGIFDFCKNLKTIHYEGTIEDWNALTKDKYIFINIPKEPEVICKN